MGNDDRSDKTIIVNLRPEPEQPSTQEPFLVSVSGKETGKSIPLKGRNLRIGRDMDCDLILDNPHISRFHAEVFWKESKLHIKDLGSTNGVFINGRKISQEALNNGDKILIGTQMYFKLVYQDAVDQSYQLNLFKAANTDALTGLYNKRYFMDCLEKEFSYSKRTEQPLSLLLIDIDHFKQVNDNYGHVVGDKILKLLGTLLSSQLRLENVSCRFGGEEFGIIIRGATIEKALHVGERIRSLVAQQKVISKNREVTFTISVGVSTFNGKNFSTTEDFLTRADELLYQAKQKGRNKTIADAA